jgi:hypothetical protein
MLQYTRYSITREVDITSIAPVSEHVVGPFVETCTNLENTM